jgi:hypothetical protein
MTSPAPRARAAASVKLRDGLLVNRGELLIEVIAPGCLPGHQKEAKHGSTPQSIALARSPAPITFSVISGGWHETHHAD